MKDLILATSNPGKITELSALLAPIHCIAQAALGISSPEETGKSFIENAILKARHVSKHANKPALADDSGLVVDALQGEPGLYSARYAGMGATDSENIQYLLKKLAQVPLNQRKAYFYCAIALVRYPEDPTPLIAMGRLDGIITLEPSGNSGFGYDPVFYLETFQSTLAELSKEIKNKISHRHLALQQILKLIKIR